MKFSRVSSKPRKVRKRVYTLPLHERNQLVFAHLSKDLRKSLKKRSARVAKGDTVRVMTGELKGKEGKVARVRLKESLVFVEGIVAKKQKGRDTPLGLKASNLLILQKAG
jgi:ribosomal protein uL24